MNAELHCPLHGPVQPFDPDVLVCRFGFAGRSPWKSWMDSVSDH